MSVSHLRATLASQIELSPSVHLGLVMRTPGIGVTATGSASLEGLARAGAATTTTTFFDPATDAEYRLRSSSREAWPGSGSALRSRPTCCAYSGTGQYQLVETANTVTTITDGGQGGTPITAEQPYVSPTVDARAVINVAVGGRTRLTESGAWALHGGYATTNRQSAPTTRRSPR